MGPDFIVLHPRCILIEDASTGSALATELQPQNGQTAIIQLLKPDQDKRVRLYIQQSKFVSGQVWFPRQAPWLRTFLDELLSFTDGKYSDQVESLRDRQATPHIAINGQVPPQASTGSFAVRL